jgi:2,4-dienoyl-CoA reductase-like NADH-dependent reductase (Old Yellow Enzyme family)
MILTSPLFSPFSLKSLALKNRIVMAPMTRAKSPGRVPGADVAAYYGRRAEGGVGLIMTEGTYIPHPGAGFDANVPNFHGEESLAGWSKVLHQVHLAGGKIMPQLWHVGLMLQPGEKLTSDGVGPSGLAAPGKKVTEPMTQKQIEQVIQAYGQAAGSAEKLGFDGIEIHGAHGYLIDQFFWEGTNQRTDRYGGDLVARTRFAVEVIEEIRRNVSADFPVVLRFSQWKQQDFSAKLAQTPAELERFLAPLSAAGVDMFHCSTRRYWEPEFEGSNLNLAGWTKTLTGKPTITVGSVSINLEFIASFAGEPSAVTGINELLERLDRGEFDLVAVGRALIANPSWPVEVQKGAFDSLVPFDRGLLAQLV